MKSLANLFARVANAYRTNVPAKARGLISRGVRVFAVGFITFLERKHLPLDPTVIVPALPAAVEAGWRQLMKSPEEAELIRWLEDQAVAQAAKVTAPTG